MMENVFGVAVAKHWIDVAGPDGQEPIANAALAALAQRGARSGGRVAFEASWGYETPLRDALGRAGVPAIRLNPRLVRAFAMSLGRLARTDRADSEVLRGMAARLGLRDCPPETEGLRDLKALQLRRRQSVEDAKREKTCLAQAAHRAMRCLAAACSAALAARDRGP